MTFVDTNATPDTTHEYTVVAVDTSRNRSDQSLPVGVTTPSTENVPPSVPEEFTAHIVSPIRIDLSWSSSTDNRGVTGYLLYLEGVQIASVGTTSYVLSGLEPGTSYTVEVPAFDAEGNTLIRPQHSRSLKLRHPLPVFGVPGGLRVQIRRNNWILPET